MTRALIFLDLDGPMIPWGPKHMGSHMFLIPKEEFPFHSRFADESVDIIKELCDTFSAKIVANTTHNGGHRRRNGHNHIQEIFGLNKLGDYLLKDEKHRNIFRTTYMSDIGMVTNRAVAIRDWFRDYPQHADLPWVAFDDAVRDYYNWNLGKNPDPMMNLVDTPETGLTDVQKLQAHTLLAKAINKTSP